MVKDIDCPDCPKKSPTCGSLCKGGQVCVQRFVDCNECYVASCIDSDGKASNTSSTQGQGLSSSALIGIICGSIAAVFILIILYLILRFRRAKNLQTGSSAAVSIQHLNAIKEEDEKFHGIQSIFTQQEDIHSTQFFSDNEEIYTKNTKLSGTGRASMLRPLGSIKKPEKAVKARASLVTATSLNRAGPSEYSRKDAKLGNPNLYETSGSYVLDLSYRQSIEPTKPSKPNNMTKTSALDISYSKESKHGKDFESRFQADIL